MQKVTRNERNILFKSSYYPAKTLWPDWLVKVWNWPTGKVKMAKIAGKWPDMGMNLLPIAVFDAVFSNSTAPIKKNGNNGHCRNAVFTNKASL